MLPARALILSPFATTPADAGQRRRVRQITKLLKDRGYATTFLLYAFEEGWKTKVNEPWLAEMRRDWNEVIVWGAAGKVGTPPVSGPAHALDEWWDETLEVVLRQLFSYRFYDLFVVNNVWLSKAFEFAPRGTVRVLDTHDIFSMRKSFFQREGIAPEFFLPDSGAEAYGASRGDIALGIQPGDAAWLSRHTSAVSYCLPYPGEDAPTSDRADYLHQDKVVFGFVGSRHIFNATGLRAYCDALKDLVGRTAAPVELRIGGTVCDAIDDQGPWVLCGYVGDEAAFLDRIDIVVAPVFDGSGFKVKVADATASGKPLIVSQHAAIGATLDEQFVAEGPVELARLTTQIALRRPSYRKLRDAAQRSHLDLQIRTARASRQLIRKIHAYRRTIAYDLTGLSVAEASCVLLSWSGAFHVTKPYARQIVVAPDPLRAAFSHLTPAGVFFVTEQDAREHAHQVWRWNTVANVTLRDWGAQPEDIWIDTIWAGALERRDIGAEISTHEAGECFWHSVTWDPIAKVIVKAGAADSTSGTERMREAVLAVDAKRRDMLRDPFMSLYEKALSVVSLDEFTVFKDLLMQIADGRVRHLAVGTSGTAERVSILRDLCAVKGIEYGGPTAGGGLLEGTASEATLKGMYRRFEERWRLDPRSAARPV